MVTTERVDMARSSGRSTEIFITLQRLKRHMREQHHEGALTWESGSECVSSHSPDKDLRESLVNMYRDNPAVNEELRLRLPPPIKEQLSSDRSDISEWPQAPLSPSLMCEQMTGACPVPELEVEPVGTHLDSVNRLGRDTNISFLLKELDALRQTNNRLQEQVLRKEVEDILQEEQERKKSWEEPAALMAELLSNQKSRDQALMSRLLSANEERDQALLQVESLQRLVQMESVPCKDSPEQDEDQDVDQLLHKISSTDSALEVQRVGSLIIQRLRSARQQRDDIIAQEMTAVIEERDGSVATCQRLLQEVEHRPTEERLLALQKERDVALEQRRRMEAELCELRANQMTQTPPLQHEAPPLLVQLQQLSLDKQNVEAELRHSREEEHQANERVQRLERLVEVLRKKVGAGSLRAVM